MRVAFAGARRVVIRKLRRRCIEDIKSKYQYPVVTHKMGFSNYALGTTLIRHQSLIRHTTTLTKAAGSASCYVPYGVDGNRYSHSTVLVAPSSGPSQTQIPQCPLRGPHSPRHQRVIPLPFDLCRHRWLGFAR